MYLSRQLTVLCFVLYWYKSGVSLIKTFPVMAYRFHQFHLKWLGFLLQKVSVSPLLVFFFPPYFSFPFAVTAQSLPPPAFGRWEPRGPEQVATWGGWKARRRALLLPSKAAGQENGVGGNSCSRRCFSQCCWLGQVSECQETWWLMGNTNW